MCCTTYKNGRCGNEKLFHYCYGGWERQWPSFAVPRQFGEEVVVVKRASERHATPPGPCALCCKSISTTSTSVDTNDHHDLMPFLSHRRFTISQFHNFPLLTLITTRPYFSPRHPNYILYHQNFWNLLAISKQARTPHKKLGSTNSNTKQSTKN